MPVDLRSNSLTPELSNYNFYNENLNPQIIGNFINLIQYKLLADITLDYKLRLIFHGTLVNGSGTAIGK